MNTSCHWAIFSSRILFSAVGRNFLPPHYRLRSLCRYDRHCRYADLCVHRSLSSHAICSSVHTTWKSRPRAGFRCTSRNCCYTWLQRLSRFLKHRPACHRVRQDPLRHGVSFSFSPDASLYRNRKKRHTSSDFHSMDTE